MVLLFCFSGLRLDVAKRTVLAARREELNWVAEAAKDLAGKQPRAEEAQISGCSGKK